MVTRGLVLKFEIPYQKAQGRDEAYLWVKERIDKSTLQSFGVSASLDYDDHCKTLCARGKGLKLDAQFLDSSVEIDLKLSFLLKAIEKKVANSIRNKIGAFL